MTVARFELESLDDLIARKPLLDMLATKNPLPEKYQRFFSKQTAMLTFSVSQSVAASFLFVKGSSGYGWLYIIGGVGSNFEQNLLFGVQAGYDLTEWLVNYKQFYGRLSLASLLAILSTMPSTIAAYSLSGNYHIPILNFFGNISMNFYGSAGLINRLIEWRQDNPKLREFLADKLSEDLKNTDYEKYLSVKYPKKLNYAAIGLGLGISVLAFNQSGYICSTEVYLENKMQNQGGAITTALVTNGPQLFIAAGPGGFDIARKTIHKIYDIYRYYTDPVRERLTRREVKFLLAEYSLIAASAFLAAYSSATSKELFLENCNLQPTFGNSVNDFVGFTVDQGAQFYNFVVASLAVDTAMDYFRFAYSRFPQAAVNDEENQVNLLKSDLQKNNEKYRIQYMEKYIHNSAIKELEKIATELYPEELGKWQQPPRKSICERLNFFKRRTIPYERLAEEPEEKKSICIIM